MDQMMFESVLEAALELNSEAIANSRAKDFHLAFAKWNDAGKAFDDIASQNTLATEQHISLHLANATTAMARGVGERHRGNQSAATIAINAANDTVDSLRPIVVDAAGTADWNGTKSGQNWHAAKGRVLTNIGALEFESKQYKKAMSTWLIAEQHLFGHCVIPFKTNAKPRHVERTLALWRAILRAALAIGDKQKASEVTCNSIRLFNAFCDDDGKPLAIRNAFLDLLIEIERLEPPEREQLDAELPPHVVNQLNDLLLKNGG